MIAIGRGTEEGTFSASLEQSATMPQEWRTPLAYDHSS